mgnify:CR=1 FL=1
MLKYKLLLLLVSIAVVSVAQIPDGYYDGAVGKEGAELKSALYNIVKGHKQYPYTSSNGTDVWDILKESDRDPDNPANVILLYTGMSVDASQEYNDGKGWTREHVWAKVHGGFGTEPGAGTDAHHLRPVHTEINSARSSRWFAECSVPVYFNGQPTGCYKSDSEWLWKPRAEVLGDVARMIFYMATRYEGENGEPDLEIVDYIPKGDNSTAPVFAKLSDLLKWNMLDPVDSFEMNRNNVVFRYQKNRNPFIDHPEYVNMIWGPGSGTPMFTSAPVLDAVVGQPYQCDLSACTMDSSDITFRIRQAPAWLTIDDYGDGTALLSGIPSDDDTGDYIVTVEAISAKKQTAEQQFYVSVEWQTGITASTTDNLQITQDGGMLYIKGCNAVSAQIFDMSGNMRRSCASESEIDISALAPGAYLLVIDTENEKKSRLFIIE